MCLHYYCTGASTFRLSFITLSVNDKNLFYNASSKLELKLESLDSCFYFSVSSQLPCSFCHFLSSPGERVSQSLQKCFNGNPQNVEPPPSRAQVVVLNTFIMFKVSTLLLRTNSSCIRLLFLSSLTNNLY